MNSVHSHNIALMLETLLIELSKDNNNINNTRWERGKETYQRDLTLALNCMGKVSYYVLYAPFLHLIDFWESATTRTDTVLTKYVASFPCRLLRELYTMWAGECNTTETRSLKQYEAIVQLETSNPHNLETYRKWGGGGWIKILMRCSLLNQDSGRGRTKSIRM